MILTKECLDEYEKKSKNYNHIIKNLTTKINLEYKSNSVDSVSGSTARYPYIKTYFRIEGINEKRIKELKKRRKTYKHKKEKLDKELEYKLKNIEEEDDAVLADIIRKRYIERKEWKQIAMSCNFASEAGPRLYLNRYFHKN